jgi:PAS domain S-box-containing protein
MGAKRKKNGAATKPARARSTRQQRKNRPERPVPKPTMAGDADLRPLHGVRTVDELRSAICTYHEVVSQSEQLRLAQAELEDSHHRYELLYDEAPVGYMTLDPNGVIEQANLTAAGYLGTSRDGILYRPLLVFVHEEDRAAFLNFLMVCRGNSGKHPQWVELRLCRINGGVTHVQLSSVGVRRESGGGVVFLTALTDVGGRVRIEQERKRAEEQIVEAMRQRAVLQAASQAKDRFLAIVSHELRTPLSAILLWTKLLRSGELTDREQLREGLHAIHTSAESQKQLIEDLLDLSRITTGNLRLEMREIELLPVVRDALSAIAPAAEAKRIQLFGDLDPTIGVVRVDPDRLRQVVWNLLTNAVKFTNHEGQVDLSLRRFGAEVEIRVSDSGIGIEPSFLPHVFESFRQADSSHSRAQSGIGVGLTIVKQLVELHGGRITAHSAGPGHGATFLVRLPLLESSQKLSARPTVAPAALESAATVLKGRSALVVEDDAETRGAVAEILRQAGLKVTEAVSAAQAIREYERSRFDLLISDIGLPETDGYALIEQIHRQDLGARRDAVPAIAFTAFDRESDSRMALEAGYHQHLAKPVEPSQLIQAVVRVFEPGDTAAERLS